MPLLGVPAAVPAPPIGCRPAVSDEERWAVAIGRPLWPGDCAAPAAETLPIRCSEGPPAAFTRPKEGCVKRMPLGCKCGWAPAVRGRGPPNPPPVAVCSDALAPSGPSKASMSVTRLLGERRLKSMLVAWWWWVVPPPPTGGPPTSPPIPASERSVWLLLLKSIVPATGVALLFSVCGWALPEEWRAPDEDCRRLPPLRPWPWALCDEAPPLLLPTASGISAGTCKGTNAPICATPLLPPLFSKWRWRPWPYPSTGLRAAVCGAMNSGDCCMCIGSRPPRRLPPLLLAPPALAGGRGAVGLVRIG